MSERELKTGEDVANAFNETDERIDALIAEKETEMEDLVESFKEKTVELEASNAAMLARLDSLTLAQKARGDWKEQDTPEAHAYGLGKFVQAMVQGHNGSLIAGPNLEKMGGAPVVKREGSDGWEGKEVSITDAKAGLSSSPLTGDDSVGSYNGSYVVPVEYRADMERVALDNSAMMGLVNRIKVPGITSYIPYTTDELTFTAVTNQNTDKTEDTFTMERRTLTTVVYAAYIAIVEEFFEDSLVEVGGLIRDMFGEAWGKKFDSLSLENATYGAVALADNTVTMDSGDSSFDDVSIDDLRTMIKQLDTKAKRSGGQFFMHPTVWDFLEDEKDANGNYRMRQPQAGAALQAHGHPVVLTDGMPDNPNDDAASTKFIGFGNPKHIWNGERVGYEFRIFDQTQSAMESGQIFLRVRTRQAFTSTMQNAWVSLLTNA